MRTSRRRRRSRPSSTPWTCTSPIMPRCVVDSIRWWIVWLTSDLDDECRGEQGEGCGEGACALRDETEDSDTKHNDTCTNILEFSCTALHRNGKHSSSNHDDSRESRWRSEIDSCEQQMR